MKRPAVFAYLLAVTASLVLLHSVALGANTQPLRIKAWGSNSGHQTELPPGLAEALDISCGYHVTVALTRDGRVVSWGQGVYGQTSSATILPGVIAVTTTSGFVAALRSDGTVAYWGGAGVSDKINHIPNLDDATSIWPCSGFIAAVKKDGRVHVWPPDTMYNVGGVLLELSNVVAVASMDHQTLLVLKSDGTITGWAPLKSPTLPVPVLSNVTAIASWGYSYMALKADGTVTAWHYDQDRLQMDVLPDLSDVKAIASGYSSSFALKSDGTVVAWGENVDTTNVPAGLFGVRKISIGLDHAMALYDSSPGVYRATGTAVLADDKVLRVILTNTGFGYTNPPVVRFVGGGGTGAKATAVIADGMVKSIVLNDEGTGYTNAPEVRIASATKPPELAMKVNTVTLDLKLILGSTYQIFASKDLEKWEHVGDPFIAEDEKLSRVFDATETGHYFRVIELP